MEIDTTCLWWYTHNLTVLHCTCLSDIWYLQSLNQFLLYFFPPGMKRFCCEEKKTTSYLFLAKMKKWNSETHVITPPCKKGKMKKRNFIISAPGPLAKKRRKSPRHIRPYTSCKRKEENLVTLEKKKRRRKNLRHIRPQTPLNCNCNFPQLHFNFATMTTMIQHLIKL